MVHRVGGAAADVGAGGGVTSRRERWRYIVRCHSAVERERTKTTSTGGRRQRFSW